MKTRDGVEIDFDKTYWYIPYLQERDFSGLHKGRIPNLAVLMIVGCLSDSRRYASTRELANRYAVEDFLDRLKDLERDLEYQLKSLKSKQGKIRQRLDLFIEQQETKESQDD